ncbi:MAG: glycosyltransferase [Rhodospirillaceae bacterium]
MVPMNNQSRNIFIITATRYNLDDFYGKSALGRSLVESYYDNQRLKILVALENRAGLPAIYNSVIRETESEDDSIFLFIHDDIHLIDFFWAEKLDQALDQFGIVGIIGNLRRLPGQTSWAFVDAQGTWDDTENLSGTIGHGEAFPCQVNRFGPAPKECKLLDGLMMAVRRRTLVEHGLLFDECFDFHFYDLDFCRQAEVMGVTMGTAAINVIHQSYGNYSSDSWRTSYAKYLKKWGD